MTQLMRKTPEGATRLSRSWQPFESLRKEVDRLFEDFDFGFTRMPRRRVMFGLEPLEEGEVRWGAVPPIDLVEKDQAYEMTAELPGLDESDILVGYDDGILTIKGEKKEEAETKEENVYVSERRYGSFQRSFRLPESVDADRIEATFQKGVLTLMLPKKPEAQGHKKQISVKAA